MGEEERMEQDRTPRLGLPLLATGQAQKELTHNEALALLDLAVGSAVTAVGPNAPPAAPAIGQAWIVGTAPVGDWIGHAGAVAGWTAAGWRFVAPFEGLSVWIVAEKLHARYVAGAWVRGEVRAERVLVGGVAVLGAQEPAIAGTGGGTVVDMEARAVLDRVLGALRAHGLIAR
jgi:hypothetical protein